MIKIIKNDKIKIVAKGAYESFYKPLGFTIIDGNKKAKMDTVKEKNNYDMVTDKQESVTNNDKTNEKRK